MLARCEHCGHENEVPDEEANTQALCKSCGLSFLAVTPEERAADRRATKILFAAILLFLAIIAFVLGSRSRSPAMQTAQRALVGGGLAGRLGGGSGGGSGESSGEGDGEGGSSGGNGNRSNRGKSSGPSGSASSNLESGLPDPLATNAETSPERSIGRLPQNMSPRKAGEEMRPGAAGSDDPAERVGNSPAGQITNAPSAGGNPGNSDGRNSVETPDGDSPLTGRSVGADASAPSSTNSRNSALLLDDFSERLRQAGARSGDLQISLEWKNVNDLDLHVIDPNGERIFYNHRVSRSGGQLDVDMNASALTTRPVENVYWPEHGAPRGNYRVEVMHFANHGGPDPTAFSVRVVNKGQPSYYRGYISYVRSANRATVPVCTFSVQ